MIPGFERIVEERIQAAQRKGMFRNLPGKGKPLVIEDDRHIPEDLRLAYKILKNADCLPPEIELKKQIQQTEDLLAAATDEKQQYRILKKLNFLILKLNTMRSGHAGLDIPQRYMDRLADKMGTGRRQHAAG